MSTGPDLNTHYFSVFLVCLGNEVHGGEKERIFLLRKEK